MPGRPAGYSDEEEHDSDDYYHDNINTNYDDIAVPESTEIESCNDPWSNMVLESANTQSETGRCDIQDSWEKPNGHDAKINSLSSFLESLQEGNVKALKEWFANSKNENSTSTAKTVKEASDLTKDVNKQSYINHCFNELGGARPIFVACRFAQPGVLDFLLDIGASLESDSYDGLTPLMSVCGNEPCLDGIDTNNFNSRLFECANILINRGKVNINAKQNQQITALMLAAKSGHLEIVNLLISNGANLNVMDSQRWTALCFAVDANHGHVARSLLEAGSDPDIMTQEGMVAADLVNTALNSMLRDIILKFSKHRSKLFAKELLEDKEFVDNASSHPNVNEYQKYSELDYVLLGIDAKEYLPYFERHGVTLEHFLALNETDLEKIGVDKVGIRKKMLTAIAEIHKRSWEKTSLPVIKTIDKQKGIYYTCPDAVIMVAKVSEHFRYIQANFEHLRKNISDCPELLRIGQDVANLSDLTKKVQASKVSIEATKKEISRLEILLKGLENDSIFRPVDLIEEPKNQILNTKTAVFVVSAIGLLTTFWYIKKTSG